MNVQTTGVATPTDDDHDNSNDISYDDTPEERYEKIRNDPERYAIIQVAISIFKENPKFRAFQMKNHHDQNDDDGHSVDSSISVNSGSDVSFRSSGSRANEDDNEEQEQDDVLGQGFGIVVNNNNNNIEEQNEDSSSDEDEEVDDGGHDNSDDEGIGNGNDNENDNNDNDGENDNNDDDEDDEDEDGGNDSVDAKEEPPEFLVFNYKFYISPLSLNIKNNKDYKSKHRNNDREVTLNPATLEHLKKRGVDFNKWLKQGIPYTFVDEKEAIENAFREKYLKKEEAEREKETTDAIIRRARVKPAMQPIKPEDIAVVGRAMATLREWIDSATPIHHRMDEVNYRSEEPQGIAHVLERCNSFQRLCLEASIENEYPSLILEKARFPHDQNRLYVLRLNEREKKLRDKRLKKEEWDRMLSEKIGFARVFKALSDACRGELAEYGDLDSEYSHFLEEGQAYISSNRISKEEDGTKGPDMNTRKRKCRCIPIVVHNGMMDLLFLLSHFHSHSLPEKISEAKALIHNYFPTIYDTKVLASDCCTREIGDSKYSLMELYENNCMRIGNGEEAGRNHRGVIIPRSTIVNPDNIVGSPAHQIQAFKTIDEAFMTGAVFQCLSRQILHQNVAVQKNWSHAKVGKLLFLDESHYFSRFCHLFGKNKLFLVKSFYTVDLDKDEPSASFVKRIKASTTFRVTGLNSVISPSEKLAQLISQMKETDEDASHLYSIWFKVVWIDDQSMYVITRRPDHWTDRYVEATLRSDTEAEYLAHEMQSSMKYRGELILEALKKLLPSQTIVTLEEHSLSKANSAKKDASMVKKSSLFGISEAFSNAFGIFKSSVPETSKDNERPLKRRRIEGG